MSGVGDNSIVSDELLGIIERVETLIAKRDDINSDIRDVLSEAKAQGHDKTIIRKVVAYRKDIEGSKETRSILDAYLNALGLL